jgi:hypothetical protein
MKIIYAVHGLFTAMHAASSFVQWTARLITNWTFVLTSILIRSYHVMSNNRVQNCTNLNFTGTINLIQRLLCFWALKTLLKWSLTVSAILKKMIKKTTIKKNAINRMTEVLPIWSYMHLSQITLTPLSLSSLSLPNREVDLWLLSTESFDSSSYSEFSESDSRVSCSFWSVFWSVCTFDFSSFPEELLGYWNQDEMISPMLVNDSPVLSLYSWSELNWILAEK